ncbi:hypothetical protein KAW65_09220 [candidate division WOR-3 bacterium]|nr:hypothetical protein [candidate division WOR-3 bacterium]
MKKQKKDEPHSTGKRSEVLKLKLKLKNWLFLVAGILFIGLGYLFLSTGSMVAAPILLVLGYCVLIPVGIILK